MILGFAPRRIVGIPGQRKIDPGRIHYNSLSIHPPRDAQLTATRTLEHRVGHAALLAAVAGLYFAVGKASLSLAIPPGYATAVWPPSGIALAALLLYGARAWPAVWIGAALVNIGVDSSPFAALAIATGNTIEALAGAAMVRQHVGEVARFQRGEDVFKFIALCALASTIAPTFALLPLAGGDSLPLHEGLRNWWTWWQGDLSGMIIVAPLLVSWSAGRHDRPWPREKKVEAAFFGALLAAAAVLLTSDDAGDVAPLSLTFVALPFLLWAAFRFGQREASTAVAAVCAIAITFTIRNGDPAASVTMNERLLLLLTFNGIVVATGLVLVTVVGERARAMLALRESHDELQSFVHLRHRSAHSARGAAFESLSLKRELARAAECEQFVLYYQPKVDVHSRDICGLEALLRWQSPARGLVSPLQFVPALEESGLIVEVGKWALRQALRDQASWAAAGAPVPRVAVNVSPIQLAHPHFVDHVREALAGAAAPMIDLEITESHLMEALTRNMAKLRELRALGIGIAIDDFGTGYSSLAYLAKLPVSVLKIDRSFIKRMLEDDGAMTLVQTILSLATSLKLRTVAEGVESEAQADMLALLGCEEMQGYLVSAAVPRDEITLLLKNRAA